MLPIASGTKTQRIETLDERALQLVVGQAIELTRLTDLGTLDPVAADFFDRRLRRRELAGFLTLLTDLIVPFRRAPIPWSGGE